MLMLLRGAVVLLVGDVVAPSGCRAFAFGEVLQHDDVLHEVVWCCTVPVPLARACIDCLTRPYLDDLAVSGLDQA